MAERQKPQDCHYFPGCEHLKKHFAELLEEAEEGNDIELPIDVAPFCKQCDFFYPRPESRS